MRRCGNGVGRLTGARCCTDLSRYLKFSERWGHPKNVQKSPWQLPLAFLGSIESKYLVGLQDRPRVLTCYKFRERCGVCVFPALALAMKETQEPKSAAASSLKDIPAYKGFYHCYVASWDLASEIDH